MRILVTNDDGIRAPGIKALAAAMAKLGSVFIVAPDREQSAVSHALTLHHPLRATKLADSRYAVDGTPTDCVNLAINALMPEKPDLVVSGINRGANIGEDVTYSGTVSAAMEATLMGVPAIAISLAFDGEEKHYDSAAAVAAQVVQILLQNALPPDTFLNLNIPDLPLEQIGSIHVTTQGKRRYGGMIVDKIDPRGRTYYWIGSDAMQFMDIPGSDFYALSRGNVSITPLHLDMTNHAALTPLRQWNLKLT